MLKPGDMVRIKDGSKIPVTPDPGWVKGTMTKAVGFVGILEMHSAYGNWFRVKGSRGNYTYHRDWLELADTLSVLNDDLTKAKAEVARIEAAIAAETHPKAGDVWVSKTGEAAIVFVDGQNVYYTFTSKTFDTVVPAGCSLEAFMAGYERVDKT